MKTTIALPQRKKTLTRQQLNQRLTALHKEYKQQRQLGNDQQAYQKLNAAHQLLPDHPIILIDLAYLELRLGLYQQAYQHYQQAIPLVEQSKAINLYDGLTEVCHHLGLKAERQKYGALSVALKKQQVITAAKTKISKPRPLFDPTQPQRNVIAFSLFGADPRYCETALLNLRYAQKIYPAWTCRYYLDNSAPLEIQQRLKEQGAQVIQVNMAQQAYSGLMWRFAVIDDPEVQFFLIRDADSLVSYREAEAVNTWLQSDRWFHCMRDSYSHSELLLAGMWGGCVGIFNDIQEKIQNYVKTDDYLSARVIDQHFLRHCLWPTIAQSLMTHDSQAYEPNAIDCVTPENQMPYEMESSFHVGSNYAAACVEVPVQYEQGAQLSWQLLDEQEQIICKYQSQVLANQKIQIHLPRHYAQNIQQGQWKICLQPY